MKKRLLALLVIALSTGLVFGGVLIYKNNFSSVAQAKKIAEKFAKLTYTPGKSPEAKLLVSAQLLEAKKADDISVVNGAQQLIKSFNYTISDEINPKLVVLSGTFKSTQPDAEDTKSVIENTFAIRMIKEGSDSSWKVDMYDIK